MISACVLVRTDHGKYEQVTEHLKQIKEVKQVFSVHGRFDVVADVEANDFESLGSAIVRMNRMSGVVFTETVLEVKTKGAKS
jgi:DNA-binding Lrp family transcriptional regulator